MRQISFTPLSFKEFNDWFAEDDEMVEKIRLLIRDIDRDPFHGLGKPEPLRGNWSGAWSRRINHEHRLIYKVSDTQILILKCRGHY
ncbi:MAG: Txe/YoeB family addiction module toxin [Bacteroidota bacterium]